MNLKRYNLYAVIYDYVIMDKLKELLQDEIKSVVLTKNAKKLTITTASLWRLTVTNTGILKMFHGRVQKHCKKQKEIFKLLFDSQWHDPRTVLPEGEDVKVVIKTDLGITNAEYSDSVFYAYDCEKLFMDEGSRYRDLTGWILADKVEF